MIGTGIIVLVHGSRGKLGKGDVESALGTIVAGLKPYLAPGVEIVGAALQFNQPSLEEAVEILCSRHIKRIIIVPYFLFAGRHITEHVPQALSGLQQLYPDTRFVVADAMGLDDSFVGLMARRVIKAAPDLAVSIINSRGKSIETESMQIVDSLLPPLPAMPDEQMAVIKRLVHASGDIEVAKLAVFSAGGVSSGVRAITLGNPIFTDVRMAMTGIDLRLADLFGCTVTCALDSMEIGGRAEMGVNTRTAAGMRNLGGKLDGAIVVIGNAPTALFALLELIDDGSIRPALIVGMPVGFVKAAESKLELMKRDIPYITVTGTRGGSALAAAAVNSLLRIARDQHPSAQMT